MAKKEKADKAERRVARRAADYQGRIHAAQTPKQKLEAACEYLRAVANDLDDAGVTDLASRVLRMANERNKP